MFTSVKMVFLVLYLIVVSQGIFYLYALSEALSGISMDAYAEIRNSTDKVIEWPHKFVYPAAVLVGLIAVVLSFIKAPGSLVSITTAIAFVCVVVDLALAVKFNLPINAQFHTYQAGMQGVDWESLRNTWLQVLNYRGVLQVVGFLALLVGMFK
ncbi:DUF1772 domain-containing protein [Pontibacter pamirensis]|uniref:DUF1772 domain-containing protein n=1 Tax=Pontibacter pamirensis TaxID=2562824 RepID=UPI001389E4EE|nr:DUF1772 domain-containing protein [Pontibacter pamirensis]